MTRRTWSALIGLGIALGLYGAGQLAWLIGGNDARKIVVYSLAGVLCVLLGRFVAELFKIGRES